ncbi:rod shape-determining protein RodA [Wolbachia pipientis]|uniref:Rod shape-determining protein RodA n=2 Tax=Wolbachia pipientis TaxID=955 RepID=A0A1E7QKG0_WOLPI|nr:rod shape-determining protein RodA [Wolbachia pipientis]
MNVRQIYWLLSINVIILSVMGIAIQYSSAGGKWSPLATHQMIVFCTFFPVIIAILLTDIEPCAYFIYMAAIVLLLISNYFSVPIAGTTRWIRIGKISLQPSEYAKIGIILALAYHFSRQNLYRTTEFKNLFKPFVIIALPVILVLKQPNLGTAVIMLYIGGSIVFTATAKKSHLFICGMLSVVLVPTIWPFLKSYHKRRILSFLNPSADPTGIGYNTQQAKIAIGSGGFFGKGFVSGSQTQLGFLPEKYTDFAFAVLSEEWGFLVSITLILLYTSFLAIILYVALKLKNYFFKLVSIGVFAFFGIHFFINIGMVIGLLPIIGDPLPFLSYGGSITSTSLICVGLLFKAMLNDNNKN